MPNVEVDKLQGHAVGVVQGYISSLDVGFAPEFSAWYCNLVVYKGSRCNIETIREVGESFLTALGDPKAPHKLYDGNADSGSVTLGGLRDAGIIEFRAPKETE